MNIRSLTRGDGVVIGAAVLLFIASFLSFYSYDCGQSSIGCPAEPNGWKSGLFPVLPSIFLAGIIAAALIVAARFQPEGRKVLGLGLDQWGTALTVFAAWSSVWTIIGGPDSISPGVGQILGLIATLALAAVALLTPRTPALKAPLMGVPGPQAPAPYGAGPNPGYGYPGGAQQPGAPGPYGAQQQPFGAQPGQPQGPQDPSLGGAAGATGAAAAPQPGAAQPAAPAADFAPFWFAVPVARPLYGEDGSPTPVAELAPGTWYLAVDQRGAALVAQTQDGRRGLLQDTTGIQRG
ncbi:hypothetical protein [Streptomyces albireticuli]|uniref:Uncharacterized protein n=1 Tax=Streptomyces albireticuli TaxID=1940 RepID=A0A2A2D3S0_9ACTN|nr:hypothetical protein [Streptomyces albireticuli]MCD9141969.1 hypothetical protein [Streptomyces albireticuli]MCD9163087.1 hypothetical protein [Streptomyces albireticuli]MCD9190143.1 hypothetical protein [Streptomyces albireticuli]PAU46049.1 hypothetical protein CK936_26205 [Streptomyces albireticuli]